MLAALPASVAAGIVARKATARAAPGRHLDVLLCMPAVLLLALLPVPVSATLTTVLLRRNARLGRRWRPAVRGLALAALRVVDAVA